MSKNHEDTLSDKDDESVNVHDSANSLAEKAELLKKSGKFEEALRLLNRAQAMRAKKNPENYWKDEGRSHLEGGRYDDAIKCFDNDLEINGGNFESFFARAVTLYLLGKFSKALEDFHRAVETKYSEKLKQARKTDLLKTYHRFEDIVRNSKTTDSEPIPYTFWYYMALTLYELRLHKDARESFQRALELKPNEPAIMYDMARVEIASKAEEACLDLLERVCQLEPALKMSLRVDPVFSILRAKKRFRVILGYGTLFS